VKRDVIVRGARGASPAARDRLARGLALRLGLEPGRVATALGLGEPLRAGAGIDDLDAVKLKAELEALGAAVTLIPSQPRMGALSGSPELLRLSALDGSDVDDGAAPISLSEPEPEPEPAPGDERPGERFAPPSGDDEAIELEVQPDTRRRTLAAPSPAPAPAPVEGRAPAHTKAPATVAPPATGGRSPVDRLAELRGKPRARLAAGVVLGLALGFVPAHGYALFAEDTLDELQLELASIPQPSSEAEYELSAHAYDLGRARIGRVRTRIAVVSGLVWLVAGGAVAYGFWRRAPP
jgi:hypothetical protein